MKTYATCPHTDLAGLLVLDNERYAGGTSYLLTPVEHARVICPMNPLASSCADALAMIIFLP